MLAKQDKQLFFALWAVIFIGGLLRFLYFSEWSLNNDELSTIYRASYDELSEVFQKGILTDNHPALLEIFIYYWQTFFGNSAFALRLPFVLFGIGSLIYIKKIAVLLFNQKTALLATALSATAYLFVLYSQIARPYSMGTFFVLLFTNSAFQIFLDKKKRHTLVLFILSGVLATLSHYLAAFSIFIIYLSGILYWKTIKPFHYLLYGLTMLLLFSPHFTITLKHFSYKSVGWLPTPDSRFFGDYFLYLFNGSKLLSFGLTALTLFVMAVKLKTPIKHGKERLILFLLFLIPLLTTYFYSIWVGPILQYSILIFSAPFLFLLVASLLSSLGSQKVIIVLTLFILFFGTKALVIDQSFYRKKYFSNFKGVIEQILDWKKTYGADSILFIGNTNNPAHFNYYFNEFGDSIEFDILKFATTNYTARARDLIEQSYKPYVCIAFGNTPVPFEVHEFAKNQFPEVVHREKYFNSEAVLYSKSKRTSKRAYLFTTDANSSQSNPKWQVLPELIQNTIFMKDSTAYWIGKNTEFALTYRDTVKNVFQEGNKYLTLEATFKSEEEANLLMVVSIKRGDKGIHWRGTETNAYYEDGWYKMIYVFERIEGIQDSDFITTYLWNPKQHELFVDNFSLTLYEDSDYDYYQK